MLHGRATSNVTGSALPWKSKRARPALPQNYGILNFPCKTGESFLEGQSRACRNGIQRQQASAVRARFRYGGSVAACTIGDSYDDQDDLVFAVQ
ncbi:hypothetical protein [Archangium violaceum]|uniref:hypothetical protein n=1 Tax=Archangium violaceum TaxID=83451 RepID=UPI0006967255|nr:hypothetical protein [Archangium violaceum]